MKENLSILFVLSISIFGCKEEESKDFLLEMETYEETDVESGSAKQVVLFLSQPATTDVEIEFTVGGSASLNGDYKLLTSSPVTIEQGETSAVIDFELIDDPIIEEMDEEIIIKIDPNDDISEMTFSADQSTLTYEFTITDNDEIPEDELQIDLTWDLGEGVSIDEVDLDLLIAVNVEIEENMVVDAEILQNLSSDNATGFESIKIGDGDIEEDEYYVVIYYNDGNENVDFTIGYSNAKEIGDEVENVEGYFDSDEAGYTVFYGPITSSSSSGRTGIPGFYKVYR